MRARQLVTIAVVALLLIGAGAALGAASPADQATDDADGETAPDTDDENATGADDGNAADASEDRANNADGVGPSDGLPEQVPDHVSEIHDRIDSFLSGAIDALGGTLSELLGGEAADGASDGNESADANESTDADGEDETESDA